MKFLECDKNENAMIDLMQEDDGSFTIEFNALNHGKIENGFVEYFFDESEAYERYNDLCEEYYIFEPRYEH